MRLKQASGAHWLHRLPAQWTHNLQEKREWIQWTVDQVKNQGRALAVQSSIKEAVSWDMEHQHFGWITSTRHRFFDTLALKSKSLRGFVYPSSLKLLQWEGQGGLSCRPQTPCVYFELFIGRQKCGYPVPFVLKNIPVQTTTSIWWSRGRCYKVPQIGTKKKSRAVNR